jgi:hypothetical protein
MRRLTVGSVVAAFALAVLPALAADLTIISKTTVGNDPARTTSQYFTKERFRTNSGDTDTIFEYASGKITHVDHKKKEYSEVTLAQMEAAMQRMSAEMEKASAQLQSMPPAVRERMEKMMGGGAGAVTVTKGGTRKIAGYDTQQYTIAAGPNLKTEVWNTTALQFPIPEADLKKFMSFSSSMAPMANNPMFKGFSKLMEEMKKVQGFSLASSTEIGMMGRTTTTTTEAVEVKPGPVAASVFAVPAGYKMVESPMAKMGGKK